MERNKKKIESSIKAGITLIKEGNLRIRTLTSVWQDAIVKLYSNGELEWLYTSDMIHISLMTPQTIGRLRVKPDESAVVAPEASYPGVFCVKHDHRVTRILGSIKTYFASADPLEAERWMHIINYTKLKHVTELMKHSHPLTPCQAEDEYGSTHPGEVRLAGPSIINSSKQTLECSYCGADICKYMPNTAKHCEFCQYDICRDCEQVLGSPQAKQLAYSSNHRHPLVKLESINDPSWYPTDFSSYICAVCKVPFNGPLYHCVECNDHDECPDCFREVTRDTPVQTSDNDMRDRMHLDIGLLAHVITKKGNDFELSKQRDRKPPQAASLTAHKCLDTPSAYFEVNIRQLDGQYVSVGIGGKSFAQNQLVGYQPNSFGYCNNGQVTVDCTLIGVLPAYGPGDTIGVGIVSDSFNVRRLYFTMNGQILGRFKVYEEFDYFPGVSFTPNTCQQLQFVVNFEGPFVFDQHRLIMDNNNKTLSLIEKLPSEIIVRCLYFAADSLKQVAKFFQISKTFESLSGDNAIWKPLFLKKWPLENSRLKLKSWMTRYKRRLETAKHVANEMKIRTRSTGLSGVHYIENCGLEYECPVVIEDLFPYDIDGGAHYYCHTCNSTVYKAEDHDTLEQYIAMNRCVGLVQKHQSAVSNRLKMLTRFFGRNSVTINDPFDPTGLAPPQPPWK